MRHVIKLKYLEYQLFNTYIHKCFSFCILISTLVKVVFVLL